MPWVEKSTLDGMAYYYNTDNQDITWEKPSSLQTAEEKELAQGEWTWVPHPVHLWQPAQKLRVEHDGSVECKPENGRPMTIPKNGVVNSELTNGKDVVVPLWPLNRVSLRFQEDDLVMLDQLNQAMIMYNLRTRYADSQLYTWVGAARSVLVSVNPYKNLPLYGEDQVKLYRFKPPNAKLSPHVFDIANDAYNSLLFTHRNQSILISGESGAGKTVATKHCLKFLAQVAGSERNVEERVVLSNPILEAFGNAQTIRNNNSSRFGKWIQIYFDSAERAIVSAEIINYLLEKSRLVGQQAGERNYHIFYQLTKSGSLGLSGPKNYRYTNVSGTFDALHIDDLAEFKEVQMALRELGFSEDEKNFLFSVAAAILHLSNCEFEAKSEKNNVRGSILTAKGLKSAQQCAQLLGLNESELVKVLSYRSIEVRGVKSVIPLDEAKAQASCDSLAMGVYARMFNWLVKRINESLNQGVQATGKNLKSIGILDIFGFEIFDQNSFEQLCINFANEKLQQQFNRTTFKEEEQLYISEGIAFTHVEFIDNQVVCDLIEKHPKGLLPMLDDECIVPEGSDIKYMNKIEDAYKKHDKFQTDTHRKLDNGFNFEIVHYAGVVKYNGENFMAKNTDSMFADQQKVCNESKNAFVTMLFHESNSIQTARSQNAAVKNNQRAKPKSTATKSLSYQFRTQLNDLMESLEDTDSRYIRCVKPNAQQVADKFISVMVNEQLTYSGVYEAVEIRRLGFPFRLTFAQFVAKYSCINMKGKLVVTPKGRSDKEKAADVLKMNRFNFDEVVFGKNRCLYKTDQHRLLTLLRELSLEKLIPIAQGVMRGHLARELRRRCMRCNEEINRAMKVGNDIDLLDEALAKIPKILKEFQHLFPTAEPTMKKKALERRAALERWKILERAFENLIHNFDEESYIEIDKLVKEGKTILHTPRTDRQEHLFQEAIEHRNALEIMVQDEKIARQPEFYSNLGNFSKVRDGKDYTKKVMFMRHSYEEVMFCFQKSRLPNSILRLGEDPELIKSVKTNLDKIMQYSGYKKHKSDEPTLANEIILFGKQSQDLADEVWVHLIKMTVKNPKPDVEAKIWELIVMATFTLKPSAELEDFIICRLGQKGEEYKSLFHQVKYSEQYKSHPDMTMPGKVTQQPKTKYSLRLKNRQ